MAFQKDQGNTDNHFFKNNIYGAVYMIIWGFLVDINIVLNRQFKNTTLYISNHVWMGHLSIVSIFLMNIYVLILKDYEGVFMLREFFISLIEIVHLIVAHKSLIKLNSKVLNKSAISYRKLHIVLASLTYLGRKYQLYVYSYIWMDKKFLYIIMLVSWTIIMLLSDIMMDF